MKATWRAVSHAVLGASWLHCVYSSATTVYTVPLFLTSPAAGEEAAHHHLEGHRRLEGLLAKLDSLDPIDAVPFGRVLDAVFEEIARHVQVWACVCLMCGWSGLGALQAGYLGMGLRQALLGRPWM